MPFYEYECGKHGKFPIRQSMFAKREALCPVCGNPAEPRISVCSIRIAEPISVYQDLGRAPDGSHRGYTLLDWRPDSGISPKPGQSYKSNKEAELEWEEYMHEKGEPI